MYDPNILWDQNICLHIEKENGRERDGQERETQNLDLQDQSPPPKQNKTKQNKTVTTKKQTHRAKAIDNVRIGMNIDIGICIEKLSD